MRHSILFSIERLLSRELEDCNTVLDLGCGNDSPVQHFDTVYSVGVDAFEPYLKESKDKSIHNDYVPALLSQVDFKPDSFDAVLLFFALEHMEKDSGRELLVKMNRWATKKIILATPNGYIRQDAIDNNPFMVHKSGWTVKELEKLGLKVKGLYGWKRVGDKLVNNEYSLLWRGMAELTQLMAYFYPEKAFQLFAVHDVK
ncbi:MAG: methyltransferase domain-containing protein [Archaeoglobaceae archaeon]